MHTSLKPDSFRHAVSITTVRVLVMMCLLLAGHSLRAATLNATEIARLEDVGLGTDFLMQDLSTLDAATLGAVVNAKLAALGIGIHLFGDDPLALSDVELRTAVAQVRAHVSLAQTLHGALGVDPDSLTAEELSERIAAIANTDLLPYPTLPDEVLLFPTADQVQALIDAGISIEDLHLDPNFSLAEQLASITNDNIQRLLYFAVLEKSGILDTLLERNLIPDPFTNYVSPDDINNAIGEVAAEYAGLAIPLPASGWLLASSLLMLGSAASARRRRCLRRHPFALGRS